MRALILGLGLLATPAMAADQFDLICNGGKEAEHYRVDLGSGEWCFGKCENVMKIAEVTSGIITLSETRDPRSSSPIGYNTINRVTGEWRWYFIGGQNITGTCSPANFSGLGTANRKF